jgi:predicted component of type VI protein secretion system
VSAHHGALLWAQGGAYFEDTSANGTLVDDELVHLSRAPLRDGARLRIGRSDFQFSLRQAGVAPTASASIPRTRRSPGAVPAVTQDFGSGDRPAAVTRSKRGKATGVPPRAASPREESVPTEDVPGERTLDGNGDRTVEAAETAGETAEFHRAELLVVRGPDQGKRIPVFGSRLTIGRDPDQVLRLEHSTVSRRHATLEMEEGKFRLRNASPQGILVGGVSVEEAELLGGEEFTLGANTLRFERLH